FSLRPYNDHRPQQRAARFTVCLFVCLFDGCASMSREQIAELAELAGGFIHDVKNHLGALRLSLQNLAEDLDEPQSPRERRALDRVNRLVGECDRLVDLSNDFLKFARAKDLEPVPDNLLVVVEEMCDFFGPMARSKGIDIKSYLPANLPE